MTMTRRIVQGFPAWEHSRSHYGASYPRINDSTHMCQQISVSPLFSSNRLRNPWPWGVVPLFIDLKSISAWNRPLLGYWDQHTSPCLSLLLTHTERERESERAWEWEREAPREKREEEERGRREERGERWREREGGREKSKLNAKCATLKPTHHSCSKTWRKSKGSQRDSEH